MLGTTRWPVAEERTFFETQCERCSVTTSQRTDVVLLFWLHHGAKQLPFTLQYDVHAIEWRIRAVLRLILDNAV